MITSRHKNLSLARHLLAALLLFGAVTVSFAQGTEGAEAEPESAAALIEDGHFYLQSGGCALAQFYFQDALRVEPNNVDAHVARAAPSPARAPTPPPSRPIRPRWP